LAKLANLETYLDIGGVIIVAAFAARTPHNLKRGSHMPEWPPLPIALSPVESLLVEHYRRFGQLYLDAIDADELDRQMEEHTQTELDAFRPRH
jgi:hypothetical protein